MGKRELSKEKIYIGGIGQLLLLMLTSRLVGESHKGIQILIWSIITFQYIMGLCYLYLCEEKIFTQKNIAVLLLYIATITIVLSNWSSRSALFMLVVIVLNMLDMSGDIADYIWGILEKE